MPRFLLAFLIAVLAPFAAGAQGEYPTRPVRVIVPFAAGGVIDVVTRIVGDHMGATLGRQLVVENKPGAGSTIGAGEVAKAAPDGYTLLVNGAAHSAIPALYPNAPFDPVKDFAPVAQLGRVPFVLAVHPNVPAQDMKSFVAWLKASPGQANFGTTGAGAASHLSGELFRQLAGIEYTHVPYRGTPAAVNDLLAGRVDFMIDAQNLLAPHVQSGALRGLAVTTRTRSKLLPDLPTFQEMGVAGYESFSWQALYGPAGLPAPIVAKLNAAVRAALADGTVQERMAKAGLEPPPDTSPDGLATLLRGEIEKWGPIIKATGAAPG
jgi:tripartite-type tricarboxylate transporter receptor subunit TctC